MVLANDGSDIKFRRSLNNLGGAIQGTEISDLTKAALFPNVTKAEADSGEIRYAGFYFYNSNTTTTMKNPIAELLQDTSSTADELWLAWDNAGVNGTMQTIPNSLTAPTNIGTWVNGNSKTTGAVLGTDLPPLGYAGLWVKNIIKFNAGSFPNDTSIIRLDLDNLPGEIDLPDEISFCIIGSSDCNSTLTTLAQKIKNRNPNFIVACGNNNFGSDATCFFNAFGDTWLKKMYPVIGVQENKSTTKYNQYKNKWPELFTNVWAYYSRDIANLHIIVMDTNHSWGTQSDQYDFITRDLDRTNSNIANDWILVFTNDEFYFSWTQWEADNPLPVYTEIGGQTKSATYHQLFSDKHVHMVFSSISENLQLSYPLQRNNTDTGNPNPTLASQAPHYQIAQGTKGFPDSVMFHDNGAGGKGHQTFKDPPSGHVPSVSPAPFFAYANDSSYGYIYVKITNTPTKKMTLSFYDTSDKLKYQFDITKL